MSKEIGLAGLLSTQGLDDLSEDERAEVLQRASKAGLSAEFLQSAIRSADRALAALRSSNMKDAQIQLEELLSGFRSLEDMAHEIWGTFSPLLKVKALHQIITGGKYSARSFEDASSLLASVREQLSATLETIH